MELSSYFTNTETTIKTLTAAVGLVGLWFGVWQYRATRIWKRQEFSASIFKELSTDPDLRFAVLLLDWRRRTLKLPDRFVINDSDSRMFVHNHQALAVAFSLDSREFVQETNSLDLKPEFETPINFMYVEIFDALFVYLERVHTFVSLGLVKESEIDGILYWAKKVSELEVSNSPVFMKYLGYYGYEGVLALSKSNEQG